MATGKEPAWARLHRRGTGLAMEPKGPMRATRRMRDAYCRRSSCGADMCSAEGSTTLSRDETLGAPCTVEEAL
jgi:hypothetical protein